MDCLKISARDLALQEIVNEEVGVMGEDVTDHEMNTENGRAMNHYMETS